MRGMKAELVLVLALVGTAMSQYQSFYAGGGWSYPGPLPQFVAANSEEGLGNRVGEATTSTQSPEQFIASHVASWPEDRQPFWFVNRDKIQQHLGRPQPQGQLLGQDTQRQLQNQLDTQSPEQGTQRQPQNQPDTLQPQVQGSQLQPQDQLNTRSQGQGLQGQQQWQQDTPLQRQWSLQNQFYLQQWLARNQPETQPQDTDAQLDLQEQRQWRSRPRTKTAFRPE